MGSFVSVFLNLRKGLRKAAEVVPSYANEKFLWVPTLAQPDPYYIFPLLLAIGGIASIRLGADGMANMGNTMKYLLIGFQGLFVPYLLSGFQSVRSLSFFADNSNFAHLFFFLSLSFRTKTGFDVVLVHQSALWHGFYETTSHSVPKKVSAQIEQVLNSSLN
jgi:hypothetical protein